MARFVGCVWGFAEFYVVAPVVDTDMIRCLDIGCLCARINIHKT